MRRFVIEIRETTFANLVQLAVAQRRPVKDHAAVLLEFAIKEQMRQGHLDESLLTEAATAA